MTSCTTTRAIQRAAMVACLMAMPAAVLTAQSSRRDTVTVHWTDPAIATVVLVDTLSGPNARAVLIRRPGDLPNNIILVTRSTSATDLSKAVTALAFSRRNKGDRVEREMRTTITASPAAAGKTSRDIRRAEADLRTLRTAPDRTIKGIAHGRAIVIRMADGNNRGKTAKLPRSPKPTKPTKH